MDINKLKLLNSYIGKYSSQYYSVAKRADNFQENPVAVGLQIFLTIVNVAQSVNNNFGIIKNLIYNVKSLFKKNSTITVPVLKTIMDSDGVVYQLNFMYYADDLYWGGYINLTNREWLRDDKGSILRVTAPLEEAKQELSKLLISEGLILL